VPELPEVEVMRRNLARLAGDAPLEGIDALDPRVVEGDSAPLEALVGHPLRAERRGKHLILRGGDQALLLHMRMTGQVVEDRGQAGRLRLRFRGGAAALLVDPRRFARARALPAAALSQALAGLGPDPWPEPLDGPAFAARFAGCAAPLKPALLDQGRVAGLGNIYAAELCWRVGLDPRAPVDALLPADWEALAAQAWALLDAVVSWEDGSEIHFLHDGGPLPAPFAVYGRAGEPCPRCGAGVERFAQAGRSTAWCPGCQLRGRRPARRSRARSRSSSSSGSKGLGR
jgi:formamidopyrimidine-DNA glycosylase